MEESFPFIVSTGPKLNDAGVRTIIRKQAMKDVGNARRKRGGYGKVNMRQPPASGDVDDHLPSSDTSRSSRGSSEDSESPGDDSDRAEKIVIRRGQLARGNLKRSSDNNAFSFDAINLFTQYETARSKFRVDLMDMSMLTHFAVRKFSRLDDPSRLALLLANKQQSYLEFVPSRYGSSPCITAAANCVMGQVKQVLMPDVTCNKILLQLYSRALKTVQDAISDEAGCLDPDVLCAIQLLSLRELLDTKNNSAWSHHINGSTRLVKNRTPARFATEYEKGLFAAHVGPAISESILNDKPCYLASPEWTDLYRSLAYESHFLHDRSPLTISLRCIIFQLPGIWYDVDKAINGPQLFDDVALAVLEIQCRKTHQDLLNWMEEYKAHCLRMSLASPTATELAIRRELLGSCLECLPITKRLLATVCDADRVRLETETQAFAHVMVDLQKQDTPGHSFLFAGQEVGIANTFIHTREEWEYPTEHYDSDHDRRMATRARYNNWSTLIRLHDENLSQPLDYERLAALSEKS